MSNRSFSDQLDHSISLQNIPQRIISLVPSQTELLADLGLDEKVIGITKFCIHPADWRLRKTIVGGTKNFHFDIIENLNPDLILGNKEENYKEGIDRLREKYPVWVSDIVSLEDALSMIKSVGAITQTQLEAEKCAWEIAHQFQSVKKYQGESVLYLIWREPWMAVGKNTFIDSMLTTIGLNNVLENKVRYPVLTLDDIKYLAPRYVFLSSEPYPFKKNHAAEILRISPASKIIFVDGEMFSWYGSRLRISPDYFNTLELG